MIRWVSIKQDKLSSSSNRYLVLRKHNNNGNMYEIKGDNKEFNDKTYIKSLLKHYQENMKSDYEAQSKKYKNPGVVKNHWRDIW
ncbi:MAG: hypothetical protein LUC34_05740 [Campylobacter sp.]|nr:hypothetical protein [Campylobacter sp.]